MATDRDIRSCNGNYTERVGGFTLEGGCNVALFDVSVRFIADTIEQTTKTNLYKINDGNPLGDF